MDHILHNCTQDEWAAAQSAGEYSASSLQRVGFIHCSRPEQILWVANQYFPGAANLLLLWINPQKLTAELRWEDLDGGVFPHIYGPLNLDAVTSVAKFVPAPDGVFRVVLELGISRPVDQ